uniref:Pentatricopeptide repeat-containing protein n=1 Tax=Chenopodium quinoa TaxID=63459 RepID=A0A803L4Z6_CHEQI
MTVVGYPITTSLTRGSLPTKGTRWKFQAANYYIMSIYMDLRRYNNRSAWKVKCSDVEVPQKLKHEDTYVDRRDKFRRFNRKKLSRKRCGGLRGRGWKFGSGFIDADGGQSAVVADSADADSEAALDADIYMDLRRYNNRSAWKVKCSDVEVPQKLKHEDTYVDRRDKFRRFNRKKLSRKRCGGLRGRGWKFGSGFIDGVFPVLSPIALKILELVEQNEDIDRIWTALDTLPRTHTTWDDIVNVAVQLRLNKKWDEIVVLCQWIFHRSSFKPDILCYNLMIDAFGQKSQHKKAEAVYLELLEARCIPTEDTYALMLRTYCASRLFAKAEAIFSEMRKYGLSSSAVVYNAYIEGLIKGGNNTKAIEIYDRMKQFILDGQCEKAEEIFELLQEAGLEPDVYAYNALMEAYNRAGYPYGAAEIFSLMQHMGCEPDRASYNIMVDAYGRAGLVEDAEGVFVQLQQLGMTPTMKSYMLLLCAYAKAGDIAKSEDFVNEMMKSGIKPDTYVMNSMMNLYGRFGQFEKMEQVLSAMEDEPNVAADISTYNILINLYGRAGYFEKMEQLFHSLGDKKLKPDVVTWTSRLGAYSRKKQYKMSLEIFEQMIDAGCFPDGGTAKVLLSSCSSEEQVEQVTTILRTMHKDVKPILNIENK